MLVGFGARTEGEEPEDDADALLALGCERSFLWSDRFAIHPEFERAMEFVRAGDTLVVVGLQRLGFHYAGIVAAIERLHRSQIHLRVREPSIVPGTPLGDHFPHAVSILAELGRAIESPDKSEDRAQTGERRRGRPLSLSKSDQSRARHLLFEKNASVIDVARQLRVSPATIYRYFPRARRRVLPKQ